MPRLGHMIVDGLAFVLVGVGLTAAVVGYARNLPLPPEQQVAVAQAASTWADPETTGSITPKPEGAAADKAASQPRARVEAVGQPSAPGTRAWSDPPRR